MLKQWTGIHHCWMIDNSDAIVDHLGLTLLILI